MLYYVMRYMQNKKIWLSHPRSSHIVEVRITKFDINFRDLGKQDCALLRYKLQIFFNIKGNK
jgi:hypothetical protein